MARRNVMYVMPPFLILTSAASSKLFSLRDTVIPNCFTLLSHVNTISALFPHQMSELASVKVPSSDLQKTLSRT